MSISSSERFEGMMVKGTFIFDICFPVKALISESEPELLEAKTKLDINLLSDRKLIIHSTLSPSYKFWVFVGKF